MQTFAWVLKAYAVFYDTRITSAVDGVQKEASTCGIEFVEMEIVAANRTLGRTLKYDVNYLLRAMWNTH
jgi:hypothetical protein